MSVYFFVGGVFWLTMEVLGTQHITGAEVRQNKDYSQVRAVLCDVIIPNFTSLSSICPKGSGRVSRTTHRAEDISTTDTKRETRKIKLMIRQTHTFTSTHMIPMGTVKGKRCHLHVHCNFLFATHTQGHFSPTFQANT